MSDEIEAGEEFVREFARAFPVKAYFWLKVGEDELRYLYIASDQFDGKNIDVGYREVLRLAEVMNTPALDPFRVKLIGVHDPLAQAALEFHLRYPDHRPTRFLGRYFGRLTVEDAYIYPPLLPTPAS